MKFSVSRDQLLKSLNYCQGVIEKRSTLPILTNVLEARSTKPPPESTSTIRVPRRGTRSPT